MLRMSEARAMFLGKNQNCLCCELACGTSGFIVGHFFPLQLRLEREKRKARGRGVLVADCV